jgi:hypothetical protein
MIVGVETKGIGGERERKMPAAKMANIVSDQLRIGLGLLGGVHVPVVQTSQRGRGVVGANIWMTTENWTTMDALVDVRSSGR